MTMTSDPPRAADCWRCDFASGHRGMDRCHVCDGTGRVFNVVVASDSGAGIQSFPGTPDGLKQAWEALSRSR